MSDVPYWEQSHHMNQGHLYAKLPDDEIWDDDGDQEWSEIGYTDADGSRAGLPDLDPDVYGNPGDEYLSTDDGLQLLNPVQAILDEIDDISDDREWLVKHTGSNRAERRARARLHGNKMPPGTNRPVRKVADDGSQ
jgi:hypothetical protein